MTFTELWLTYEITSRLNKPATAQLIELEFQNQKLVDLEDVLDHVFRQGYVEPKHRPSTWWEKNDGEKIKSSQYVEELLEKGIGKCPDTALKLVVADIPPAMWFSYIYLKSTTGHVVTQRIKFSTLSTKFEVLAHATNYIFSQGFVAPKHRPLVHWEGVCGKKIEENILVDDLLSCGEGVSEDKPLRLVIDNTSHHCHAAHVTCHSPCH